MVSIIILSILFILLTFLGYVFHWMLHQKWMGLAYIKHMNHHLKQYPPEDFYSDKYRSAGADNSFWLFAVAFSPIIAILIWSVLTGHISFILGTMIAIEMTFIGWLNDNMHDSFHIRKTFWHKFPFFQKLIKLHYNHHINMNCNFGIFSFFWDKIFGSFKDE